jgi:hypothetical protein
MKSNRRLILFAVAFVTAAIMLSWHVFWVQPRKDCANQGGTWDDATNACARPVSITPMLAPTPPPAPNSGSPAK